jgi:hypothetical protein
MRAGLTNDDDKVIDTPILIISRPLGSNKALTVSSMLSKLVPHPSSQNPAK